MPLHPGKSRAVFSENVREMMRRHPQAQALAAAYREQRQSRAPGGGVFPGLMGTLGAGPMGPGTFPGPQAGLGSLGQRTSPAAAPAAPMGMPPQMPGLGNLRRPGFQDGGAPSDDDYYGGLARDLPGELSTPPKEWGRGDVAAMGASAADPFGLSSYLAGKVSPETGAAWRGLEEAHPEATEAGSFITPLGVVGRGLGAAGAAARAFPKTAAGLGAAGALAAGTAEAGDQPKGRPEFTQADNDRLTKLDADVKAYSKEKQDKLSASAKKGEPKSVRDGIESTYSGPNGLITQAANEAQGMRSNMQTRQQDYDKKGEPLAIRDPEFVDEMRKGAIGWAMGHGTVRGLLGGSPWRAAGTAAMGGGEALIGAFAPTMLDLFQPPDTQAYKQAHDNLQNPEFWKTVVAPDVLYGGAASAVGHGAGYTAREVAIRVGEGIASAARGIRRLFSGEPAAEPAAPGLAAAGRPWPTNPDGTRAWPDSYKDLQGLKKSDKDGRWRDRFGHVVPQNLEPPGKAEGGGLELAGYQGGGAPWFERSEARALGHTGPVIGSSLGRGDSKSITVPGGSYVLPAKFVSGLGQGNTMAGHAILNSMFSGGPYGTSLSRPSRGGIGGPPRPPRAGGAFAAGGPPTAESWRRDGLPPPRGHNQPSEVPIRISDGEHVLSPPEVRSADEYFGGPGSIDHGHRTLDAWVIHEHEKLIKELKKLPGPAKD
jgi:hypothetical protein